MTIHFDKAAPDTLEQWLSTEARYIISTFGKSPDLHKVYGDETDAVIAECKSLSEKIVSGITMILDSDLRKLYLTLVRLENGKSFLIDGKYRLVENADTNEIAKALVQEDSPRVFSVTSR